MDPVGSQAIGYAGLAALDFVLIGSCEDDDRNGDEDGSSSNCIASECGWAVRGRFRLCFAKSGS